MYDFKYEPHRIIFMIDNKSFFASCEALRLGLNPMKVCIVVISRQPDAPWGSGLIMAASPLAKKKYNLHNVMRARNLPSKKEAPDLMLVDPHMNLYIKRSMQVLDIFRKYAADEDIHMYSIDEGMIDMATSWKLFGNDPYNVAHKIQKDIHDTLGIYTTCGIGENPLLAKLAMDNEAKHNKSMVAFWHYIDVPDTIWRIPKLEDVWGALILALLIIYVELALIMSTNWRTLIQQFSRKNLVLLVSSYLRKAGALIVVLSVISITQKLKAMATHKFYKETILSNEKSKLSFEKSANKSELEFEHIICVQARLVFISASPFQN